MRIVVAAVGRVRSGPVSDLVALYARRCPWPVDVVEVPVSADPDAQRRRAAEAQRLEQAVAGCDVRVLLDETGVLLTSEAFAGRLGTWRDEGSARIGFQIGGPDGVDPELRSNAGLVLAFGRMTWPHQLVRAMLAEQIYRASSILAGHPYHRT